MGSMSVGSALHCPEWNGAMDNAVVWIAAVALLTVAGGLRIAYVWFCPNCWKFSKLAYTGHIRRAGHRVANPIGCFPHNHLDRRPIASTTVIGMMATLELTTS